MNVDVYFLNTFSYYESLLLAFQKEKKLMCLEQGNFLVGSKI